MTDLFSYAPRPALEAQATPAHFASSAAPVIELLASVDGKTPQKFIGRVAWALHELVQAGDGGCTPITHPGPRWSDYVHKARKAGVLIETIDEGHGGAFAGTHARYRLASTPVVQVDTRGGQRRRKRRPRAAA